MHTVTLGDIIIAQMAMDIQSNKIKALPIKVKQAWASLKAINLQYGGKTHTSKVIPKKQLDTLSVLNLITICKALKANNNANFVRFANLLVDKL